MLLSDRMHLRSVDLRRPPHIGHLQRLRRIRPLTWSKWKPYSPVRAGLCDSCVHQKLIRTGRGSVFSMCLRSKTDERFPKYPRIPVERCPGYERKK